MRTFGPLDWIALGLLVAVAAAVMIRRRFYPPIQSPSCGRCGYNVTGLAGERCPECGANLTEVGVRMPGDQRPTGRVMRAVLWTMLVGAVTMLAAPRISKMLPYPRMLTVSEMLGLPRSRAYESVAINGHAISRDASVLAVRSVTLTLTKLGGEKNLMTVDLVSRRGSYVDAQGNRHDCDMSIKGGADVKSLRSWFRASGVDTSARRSHEELAELALALQDSSKFENRQAQGIVRWTTMNKTAIGLLDAFGNRRTANAISRAPDPWRWPIVIGPWVGVWLMGLLVIALRRPGRPETRRVEPSMLGDVNSMEVAR